MIFFDTNLLIYSTVNQDEDKQETSDRLIEAALKEKSFLISPLIITEFIFVLTKLAIDQTLVESAITLYKPFVKYSIDASLVFEAYELCKELKIGKNINDAVHLKFAEKYGSKIVTFDNDFKRFKDYANIEIEIL